MMTMKRLANRRYAVLAGLVLVGAGLAFFAVVGAGAGGTDPTPTLTATVKSGFAPAATISSTELPPPPQLLEPPSPTAAPVVPRPDCVLTVLDAGAAIHKHDASGRLVEVGQLQTVRNECTGEILTRDSATGQLTPCTTLVTIPAEPAYRLNPATGQEEQVAIIEVLKDFCTGEVVTRDVDTGEISPTHPVVDDDIGYPPEFGPSD